MSAVETDEPALCRVAGLVLSLLVGLAVLGAVRVAFVLHGVSLDAERLCALTCLLLLSCARPCVLGGGAAWLGWMR